MVSQLGELAMTKRKDPTTFLKSGRKPLDLTGQRFGSLVALSEDGYMGRCTVWLCQCDCGARVRMRTITLRGGAQSCRACGNTRQAAKIASHGMHRDPVYKAWRGMRSRCENPNDKGFHNYGGRGIRVCERWQAFPVFYEDMGDPPPGMSIDRIDNDGDYEPGNCRWATVVEQGRNRRTNRLVTFNGQTKCVTAWAEESGLTATCLLQRLKRGWAVELALTAPAGYRGRLR
jgi:hypothetical protein